MNEDLEGNLNKKRKISIHMEEEVTGRDDRADPTEKEVDNVVVLVDDVADPPLKPLKRGLSLRVAEKS